MTDAASTSKRLRNRAGVVVAALAAALSFGTVAHAQTTLTWSGTGNFNGPGTWNTSNLNWWNSTLSGGSGANQAWATNSTDIAAFGTSTGTGSTVTVSGSVSVGGIIFNPLSVTGTTAGSTFTLTGGTIGIGSGNSILTSGSWQPGTTNRGGLHTITSALVGSNLSFGRATGTPAAATPGVILNGSNTLSGTLTVSGTTVVLANFNSVNGVSTIDVQAGSSFGANDNVGTFSSNIQLGVGANLTTIASPATYSGTITLLGDGANIAGNAAAVTTFQGPIVSGGAVNTLNLTKRGILVFTGSSTFSGTYVLNGVNPSFGATTILDGGDNRLPSTSSFSIQAANQVLILGTSAAVNQTFANFWSSPSSSPSFTSAVQGGFASGTSTLTVNLQSGTSTFYGKLGGTSYMDGSSNTGTQVKQNNSGNNLAFVKSGGGTFVLGNANTYTGTTAVTGGTLVFDPSFYAWSGSTTISDMVPSTATITIGDGATLAFKGRINQAGTTLTSGTYNQTSTTFTVASTAGLVPGATISGSGIAAGTYVQSITSNTKFVASQAISTGTYSSQSITVDTTNFTTAQSIAGLVLPSGTGTVSVSNAGQGTSLTVTGAITGNGALSKTGDGTLALTAANTFGGGTLIGNGSLVLDGGNDRLLSTGAVTIGSSGATGRLVLGGAGAVSQMVGSLATTGSGGSVVGGNASTSTLIVNQSSGTSTFAGSLGGSGANENNLAFEKRGAGTLTLSGSSSLIGGIALTAGQLNINNANALGGASNTFTITGGTLDNTSGGSITVTGNAQNWNGSFAFAGSNPLNLGTGAVALNASPQVTVTSSTLTVGGGIAGNFGLTKAGAGQLTLSASNSFTGGVTINDGAILISNTAALGTGTVTLAGGRLNIGSRAISNTLNVTGSSQLLFGGASSNNQSNSALTGSGTLSISTADGTAGAYILGSFNNFSGLVVVSATGTGAVEFRPSTSTSPLNGRVNLVGTSTTALAAYRQEGFNGTANIGELSGNQFSSLRGGNGAVTFSVGSLNTSTEFAGSIVSALSTTTSFTKVGTGVLTLSGSNGYAGATTVSAGRLDISPTGSLNSTSGITVNGSGAEFKYNSATALTQPLTLTRGTLSGTGSINTPISIGANVILSPGNSPGTQSYQSGTFAAGGSYTWEINNWASGTAGANFDQANFTNGLAITASSGAPFTINLTSLKADNTAGAVPGFNNGLTGLSFAIATGSMTGFSPTAFALGASGFFAANTVSGSANGGVWLSTNSGSDQLILTYAPSARYTLSATPAATAIYAGGSTVITGSITSSTADRTGADAMRFSNLSVGTGSLSVTSGTLTAGMGTGGTVTFSSASTGQFTFTPTVSATNVNLGTGALPGTVASGTVTVWNAAAANTLSAVSLGNIRVSGTFGTQSLTITNTAAAGSYTEVLGATGSTAGLASLTGSVSALAGGSASTAISVGIGGSANTATAGVKSGSATLSFTSSGGPSSFIPTAQAVAVSGTVYDFAQAKFSAATLDFGVVHKGASVSSQNVAFGNQTVTNASYQDRLDVSATTGNARVTAAGFTGLAASAGGTTTNNLVVSVNTATAGSLASTVSLTLTSNANGVAGLANGTAATVGGGSLTTAGGVFSGHGVWAGSSGGAWGTGASANWTSTENVSAAPGTFAGFTNTDIAEFGSAISSGTGTITLDGAQVSLASLSFTNTAGRYVIQKGTGSGSLTLAASSGKPFVSVLGTHEIATAILGTSGLQKTGIGKLILSGSNNYSGGTEVAGGTLAVNGSIAGNVSVLTGAELGGSGVIAGNISGDGLIGPGNSPGILTVQGKVDPTATTSFAFEFMQQGDPIWSAATASKNDVLQLTNAAPFVTPLISTNIVNIYFEVESLAKDDIFRGGFFSNYASGDLDFGSAIGNPTYQYYVLGSGSGTHAYNGKNYYTFDEYKAANVGLGITAVTASIVTSGTADFSGGTIYNGQVTQFAIIPEPDTIVFAGIGIAMAGWSLWKRRRIARVLQK